MPVWTGHLDGKTVWPAKACQWKLPRLFQAAAHDLAITSEGRKVSVWMSQPSAVRRRAMLVVDAGAGIIVAVVGHQQRIEAIDILAHHMHDKKGDPGAADRNDAVVPPGIAAAIVTVQNGPQGPVFAQAFPIQKMPFSSWTRQPVQGMPSASNEMPKGWFSRDKGSGGAELHFASCSTLRIGSMRAIRASRLDVSSAGSCSQMGSISAQAPSISLEATSCRGAIGIRRPRTRICPH